MNKSPICQRLLYIDPITNKRVYQGKKKYRDPELALKDMRNINKQANQFHKVEAYKCTTCLRFHIGKTKKKLQN